MSFGGLAFAFTAVQAISQIGQGYVQREESNLNATILEGKAGLIDVQKNIENVRFERIKRRVAGTTMANIAGSGIEPQGSAMAVMLDTQTQIGIDQAISQMNLEQEKRYTTAQAETARRKGKYAVRGGYTGAFSTMLTGGADFYRYKTFGSFDTSAGAKQAGKGR